MKNSTVNYSEDMSTASIGNQSKLTKFSKEKITAKSITDTNGNVTKEADRAYGEAVMSGDVARKTTMRGLC
ncbi:MAG: hypothetical protein Q4A65_02275 [Bacillota bacterium]|nr:hypothetical protein [Bacillota bacterium]